MLEDGNTVKVHYTGKLADGTVFDTSVEREPLEFTIGEGGLIPGFEKAVRQMDVGESKEVTIPADEAYGDHHDDLIMLIDRDQLPKDLEPAVGQRLQVMQKDGTAAIVIEVSDKTITIDANHPLAGKDLTFDIQLVEVK